MVIAVASVADEPEPDFKYGILEGFEINDNLTGRYHPIGVRSPEITQRLAGLNITSTSFPEFVENTRFDLGYILINLFYYFEFN